jgi:predicted RNA-binding protein YlxR (DUF448 family)
VENCLARRTCVVCRKTDEQEQLIRFGLQREQTQDGKEVWRLTADLRRRLPGRGVYVHRSPACLQSRKLEQLLLSGIAKKGPSKKLRSRTPAEEKREKKVVGFLPRSLQSVSLQSEMGQLEMGQSEAGQFGVGQGSFLRGNGEVGKALDAEPGRNTAARQNGDKQRKRKIRL